MVYPRLLLVSQNVISITKIEFGRKVDLKYLY